MRLSPRVSDIGREHLQVAPRRLERPDPGFLNQVDERRRAAVHDRHFRRVELDDDVVDAETDERGQQVLDGVDLDGVAHQAGRVVDRADVLDLWPAPRGRRGPSAENECPNPPRQDGARG